MDQVQQGQPAAKVLHRHPEIIALTENRIRTITGGVANLGASLRSMSMATKQPTNVVEYQTNDQQTVSIVPESPAATALREQQRLINQARLQAEAAQNQSVITENQLEKAK